MEALIGHLPRTQTQLYSDLNTTNNNLSKAIFSSNLLEKNTSPRFVEWNGNTLNTPYKAGLTDCQEGFAFCYGNFSDYMTVIAFAKNSNKMWAWSKAGNTWIEYATKDDLNNVSNKLILSGMKTLSVKWVNGNIMEFYVDNTRVFGISAKWNENYS